MSKRRHTTTVRTKRVRTDGDTAYDAHALYEYIDACNVRPEDPTAAVALKRLECYLRDPRGPCVPVYHNPANGDFVSPILRCLKTYECPDALMGVLALLLDTGTEAWRSRDETPLSSHITMEDVREEGLLRTIALNLGRQETTPYDRSHAYGLLDGCGEWSKRDVDMRVFKFVHGRGLLDDPSINALFRKKCNNNYYEHAAYLLLNHPTRYMLSGAWPWNTFFNTWSLGCPSIHVFFDALVSMNVPWMPCMCKHKDWRRCTCGSRVLETPVTCDNHVGVLVHLRFGFIPRPNWNIVHDPTGQITAYATMWNWIRRESMVGHPVPQEHCTWWRADVQNIVQRVRPMHYATVVGWHITRLCAAATKKRTRVFDTDVDDPNRALDVLAAILPIGQSSWTRPLPEPHTTEPLLEQFHGVPGDAIHRALWYQTLSGCTRDTVVAVYRACMLMGLSIEIIDRVVEATWIERVLEIKRWIRNLADSMFLHDGQIVHP